MVHWARESYSVHDSEVVGSNPAQVKTECIVHASKPDVKQNAHHCWTDNKTYDVMRQMGILSVHPI